MILRILCLLLLVAGNANATSLRSIYVTDATTGTTARVESDGSQAVSIQDQTSPIVDLNLHVHRTGTVSINTNTAQDSSTVIINSDILPVIGNCICLKESQRTYQGEITSFTGTNPYTLTLDTPLDYAFTTAATASLTVSEMAVDGSAVRVIYHIKPPPGVKWDIVRMMFYIEDSSAMDDGLFGGATALTNGVVLRVINGEWHNVFNVKSNGEFAERAYDRVYVTKPPAGTGHSMIVRRTFGGQSKNGVVIRLDGDSSDEIEFIIQDDLTALDHFRSVIQGHEVTN